MTTKQLQKTFTGTQFSGYGHYRFGFIIRNKEYKSVTNNIDAIERINMKDEIPDRATAHRYTLREAYQALYNELRAVKLKVLPPVGAK